MAHFYIYMLKNKQKILYMTLFSLLLIINNLNLFLLIECDVWLPQSWHPGRKGQRKISYIPFKTLHNKNAIIYFRPIQWNCLIFPVTLDIISRHTSVAMMRHVNDFDWRSWRGMLSCRRETSTSRAHGFVACLEFCKYKGQTVSARQQPESD